MYKLYMRSDTGHYMTPIYFDKLEKAIHAVSPYIKYTPEIMITNGADVSVFETKKGILVHPNSPQLEQHLITVPQRSQENLNLTALKTTIDSYKQLTKEHFNKPTENPDINETRETKIKQLEAAIHAIFAATKINPYQHGYQSSDTIETEASQRQENETEC